MHSATSLRAKAKTIEILKVYGFLSTDRIPVKMFLSLFGNNKNELAQDQKGSKAPGNSFFIPSLGVSRVIVGSVH